MEQRSDRKLTTFAHSFTIGSVQISPTLQQASGQLPAVTLRAHRDTEGYGELAKCLMTKKVGSEESSVLYFSIIVLMREGTLPFRT